jgi:tRNA threonylcarbamoyladenosine biosynthesis protein TsaB
MKAPSAQHVLAIDTATAWQSVALVQGERVLALAEQNADGSHARSLMGAIDRVLRESGLSLREVQNLAVSIGPGSFTGLRVGLATMLGFRAVLGTIILPVPTLEAMAWNLRGRQGLLVPVLKSRHNEVYWATYEWLPDATLHTRIAEQVGPPATVSQALQGVGTATLFGDGWQAYEADIRQAVESVDGKIQEVAPEQQRSSAVGVALAARRRLESGWVPEVNIVPLYVQRTEAEIKFDEQQGISALERRRERLAKQMAPGRRKVGREGGKPRAKK